MSVNMSVTIKYVCNYKVCLLAPIWNYYYFQPSPSRRENLYRFQLGDISKVTKQNFPSSEEHYKICIGISNNNFDNVSPII